MVGCGLHDMITAWACMRQHHKAWGICKSGRENPLLSSRIYPKLQLGVKLPPCAKTARASTAHSSTSLSLSLFDSNRHSSHRRRWRWRRRRHDVFVAKSLSELRSERQSEEARKRRAAVVSSFCPQQLGLLLWWRKGGREEDDD